MEHVVRLLLSLVVFVHFGATSAAAEDKKLNVVCTIGQICDVVAQIGKDNVRIEALMGPGVDPHLYRASESDVRRLTKADLILYNGLHLEAKMGEIFERMAKSKKVVAVASDIPKDRLLGDPVYPDAHDPHIWFDVELWAKAAEKIVVALSEADPVHKEIYEKNGWAYIVGDLAQLHEYTKKRADELDASQRVLVTAHDAFRYFGRAYGFEVVGLQGISTESEAGTKDVIALADMIAGRKIKAIFVESSVPERNIKAVQEAVRSRGWDVRIGGELFSDALGSAGTKEGTYIGMVEHNIDTIVGALK